MKIFFIYTLLIYDYISKTHVGHKARPWWTWKGSKQQGSTPQITSTCRGKLHKIHATLEIRPRKSLVHLGSVCHQHEMQQNCSICICTQQMLGLQTLMTHTVKQPGTFMGYIDCRHTLFSGEAGFSSGYTDSLNNIFPMLINPVPLQDVKVGMSVD